MQAAEQIDYKVQLDAFEGPLDLLLYLVKKEDIDVYDIPISHLLSEYIKYIDLARELNIDLAGDFLEMAAELAYIKSRLLLPESTVEEEEGPDPRAELVARLLEYQKYKEAAQSLLQRPLLGKDVFTRTAPLLVEEERTDLDVDLLSLLSAFERVLKKLPKEQVHEVFRERVGVAERVMELADFLKGREQVRFEDLFAENRTRQDVVVTFLAVLEMARQKLLRVVQGLVYGEIVIHPAIA